MVVRPNARQQATASPVASAAGSLLDRVEPVLFWGVLALLAAMLVLVGPILTSDGPAHVSIAHFLRHAGDPGWPALNRIYEVNPALSPNALGHMMLTWLMLALSPLAAETVLQGVCLLGIPLAARLLLRRISPASAWVALFFVPVALQRMFFLGLYNFSLSVAGFLLCLWAWIWLRARPGALRTGLLALLLLLTLGCQAAGWLEAGVAIWAMLVGDSIARRGTTGWRHDMLALVGATCLAFLPSLVLFALFASNAVGGEALTYGAPPLVRVAEILVGAPFAPIGRITALVSLIMGALLLGMAVLGGARAWLGKGGCETDRGLRLGICWVPLGLIGFMLIVPERAAGGWSHVWRAEAFPYLGLALVVAVVPVHRWLRQVATGLAAGGGLVAIVATTLVQVRDARPVLHDFAEIDALIPAHCTIAPVLGHYKLDRANTAQLFHHPTFHLALRMQWRDDRPVLFSYNARLPLYPARFRHDADPQRLLYGWARAQGDTLVRKLDIPGWEAATGIPVDFVLLWDVLPDNAAGPQQGVRQHALAGYALVHRSQDGRMELYRRGAAGGCGLR